MSDLATHAGVRTFTPRWRTSALTEERIATLLPARRIPAGVLHPEQAFGRVAPVVLEIGSGHGAAAIAYAAAHPHVDLLAVEVHVPGVARMLAAAEAARVANLWVEPDDALPLLRERLPAASLAAVHLFFPDPWPKKRHAKRRFIQQHTLDLLASRLEPGGRLLVATDHAPYAAHVRHALAAHQRWEVHEGSVPAGGRSTASRPRASRPGGRSPICGPSCVRKRSSARRARARVGRDGRGSRI